MKEYLKRIDNESTSMEEMRKEKREMGLHISEESVQALLTIWILKFTIGIKQSSGGGGVYIFQMEPNFIIGSSYPLTDLSQNKEVVETEAEIK